MVAFAWRARGNLADAAITFGSTREKTMGAPRLASRNVSAFFIDTAARSDKRNGGKNGVRKGAKGALLALQFALLFKWTVDGDSFSRKWIVLLYSFAFLARISIQMVFFWKRRITWNEVWAEAGGVIPLSLASFAYGASSEASAHSPLDAWDAAACALFLFGTYLNVASELQRHLFKLRAENCGKLYTGGLFKYCRRVNYTGEILSFVGFAMATGPGWRIFNMWVPFVMGGAMATFSKDEIEHYLSLRYKEQWVRYKTKTPHTLIPGVY